MQKLFAIVTTSKRNTAKRIEEDKMITMNAKIKDVVTGEITHSISDKFVDVDKVRQWAHRQGVVGHDVIEVISNGFCILENSHNGHRCTLSIDSYAD